MKKILLSLLCLGMCFGIVGCSPVEEENEAEEQSNTINNLDLSTEQIKELLQDDGYTLKADNNSYSVYNKDTNITLTKDTEDAKTGTISFNSPKYSEHINGTYAINDKESCKGYLAWLDKYGLSHMQMVNFFNECLEESRNKEEEDTEVDPKVSIMSNFISNGYEEYNGNYRKDVKVNGTIMHKYFYLSGDDHYFSVSDDFGNETTYFFTKNYAGQNKCKFSFSSNKAKKGSTCSSSEKENAKYIKEIFEKEIKELGITVNDLK